MGRLHHRGRARRCALARTLLALIRGGQHARVHVVPRGDGRGHGEGRRPAHAEALVLRLGARLALRVRLLPRGRLQALDELVLVRHRRRRAHCGGGGARLHRRRPARRLFRLAGRARAAALLRGGQHALRDLLVGEHGRRRPRRRGRR
ncbi:hypothetical protein STCU_12386 [Strigomonas culicis]|uniref:Uncharacterized protein n=1 Tax=Strigomonas culicis TaxID=28005 RepID=S9UX02_9TRYP|nr:hypothetical protein STCU_12386 [Strigomonas culicis]|eukprot:EPY15035.1 hypothetical protein STCU_12386 [Strigomonas culicis]